MAVSLARVAHVLTHQHALIARRQLGAAGLTRDEIEGLLRSRALIRIRPGIYLMNGAPRSWPQALLAAVLAAGRGAVASHSSAGRLWDFAFWPESGFEITVPRPREPLVAGVHIHTSSVLDSPDTTTRLGVPCTTFERSLCDSTTRLSQIQLGRVLDNGLRRRVTSIDRLQATVLRLDSGPRRRLTLIQALIEQRGTNFDPGGSDAELRVLRVIRKAGLEPPKQQVRVRVNGRTYFLDYAYPERKRFVEYYELKSHGTPSAVAYDSERITALSKIGWTPVIFTDATSDADIAAEVAELLTTPDEVVVDRAG